MGQKQVGLYCAHCKKNVMSTRPTPNHVLHLLLTILTFGLWLFVWACAALWKNDIYRCTQCGSEIIYKPK